MHTERRSPCVLKWRITCRRPVIVDVIQLKLNGRFMDCPICNRPIDFPIQRSFVKPSGQIFSHAICTRCSRSETLFTDDDFPDVPAAYFASHLRSISEYIRTNKRWPTAKELGGVFPSRTPVMAEYDTQEFDEHWQYIDSVADFIDSKNRLPTHGELPEPESRNAG